jgi:hypothetical protein
LPNITGSFDSAIVGEGEGAFTTVGIGFSLSVTAQGGNFTTQLDASKGETKTDGSIKTASEHHVYGAANGVQPQNISIRLWKRIS